MNRKGVASVGECMLELSARPDGAWDLGYAGDTFNTLWAIRALTDAPCDYVTAFGDDPFSARQIDFLSQAGIGIASSPIIPGARPGLYAITLTGAERSFTYWRSDAAARQLASQPAELSKSLETRALVYFSGITLAILGPTGRATLLAEIARARKSGSLVAFDPNYRPRLWVSQDDAKAAISQALAVTDIALPTFPDEQMLFGDVSAAATAARLASAGVREVVVKDGANPCLVVADGAEIQVPAIQVDNPVDTTGAGDSFNGGYLSARLIGRPPTEAAAIAHRVAAAVVQVRGALAPYETLRSAFAKL